MTRTLLVSLILLLPSFASLAGDHAPANAALNTAIEGFNEAYAENNVDDYFDFYADDATVYFYGARQDLAAYRKEWANMVAAGGGVELNEMSDLRVQLMPSGEVAVVTSFVDNRTRAPDGTTSTVRAFETDVWRKIDGSWKIISLHYSEIPSAE